MNLFGKTAAKVKRKITKFHRWFKKKRLQPISVFLFHQVSDSFDPTTMNTCDWTETAQFKNNILKLRQKYKFITLSETHRKIANDHFRLRKYAALTSDDGWASLKNILPWLSEQNIPVTLFVNPAYFDGSNYRDKPTEKYLTESDLQTLCSKYKNISIGSHGWEHNDVTLMTEDEFSTSVDRTNAALQHFESYIPFYCYTWGKYNDMTQEVLRTKRMTPVMIDKETNIDDKTCIHRILIDGIKL